MELLITPSELNASFLHKKIVILDCTFYLNDVGKGRKEYYQGHIPNSFYLDTTTDLSGPIINGITGRHPLPDHEVLTYTLRACGLDDGDLVVAYDQSNGVYASRAWWLLNWLGHTNVVVLNGGFAAWKKEGYGTETASTPPLKGNFQYHLRPELTITQEELKHSANQIVDSREWKRYTGELEPIDPKAGHIPGAICMPYLDNVDQNGIWKPKDWLEKKFESLSTVSEPIFYCGSGVTACHNILAYKMATGLDSKLYGGSWSEWIHRGPIALGDLP